MSIGQWVRSPAGDGYPPVQARANSQPTPPSQRNQRAALPNHSDVRRLGWMGLAARPCGWKGPPPALVGEGPADRGPGAPGLVDLGHVPAVVEHLDPATRDPAAELLRVPDRDQRVLAPPDDERWHLDAGQSAAEAVVGDR